MTQRNASECPSCPWTPEQWRKYGRTLERIDDLTDAIAELKNRGYSRGGMSMKASAAISGAVVTTTVGLVELAKLILAG